MLKIKNKIKTKEPNLRFKGFKEEWEEVRLEEITFFIKRGYTPKNYTNQGIQIIKQGQIRGGSVFNFSHKYYCESKFPCDKLLKKGDILINSMGVGTVGRIGYWHKDSNKTVESCITIIRPNNEKILSKFLFFYLIGKYKQKTLEKKAKGSTGQISLHLQTIKNLLINRPLYQEQTKIANFLSLLDERINIQKELIKELELLKKSLLNQIMDQKIKFKGFKEGWEEKKLEEIAEINPTTPKPSDEFIYLDLSSVKKGNIISYNKMNKQEAPVSAKRVLQQQDILFASVRPYQQNNLFFNKFDSYEYVASTGFFQLRSKLCNSKFLYYALHTKKINKIVISCCTGTAYPAINLKFFINLVIFLPSLPEQTKIANFLSLLDERITLETDLLSDYKTEKQYFLKNMLV